MSETTNEQQQYCGDRMKLLKAFDETKAGVKGLVDSGLLKVPDIFVRPSHELAKELTHKNNAARAFQIPVIDLTDIHSTEGRKRVVKNVKIASKTWGFFRVLNHGIPTSVLHGVIDEVRNFHEQDAEERKKYYARDSKRSVRFASNLDLYTSRSAIWSDMLSVQFPDEINTEELPHSCRESTAEYAKHVTTLGDTLLELLSEALGLKPDHLNKMECSKGFRMNCHYYPSCPEPHLTLGAKKHSDFGFITILLQNQINGFQVSHQDQWVDVEPIPGSVSVNLGDFIELVSNGEFVSNTHRVLANRDGPRISVARFFAGNLCDGKVYAPIKELLSEENPARYRDVIALDYAQKHFNTHLDDGSHLLDSYKL